MRPILSTIGTYNYNLSKYLVTLLTPLTGNSFTVKDSFRFVEEISHFRNNGYTMASFDVCSLFTNIPVSETIEIILTKLFTNNELFNGFDKNTFKKLLELCCRDNLFLFNKDLYLQKDGAPMGGCVSPTVADIFLSHHEENWLSNCPNEFKPVLYRRYVDDTFVLFRSRNHVPLFLQYLNSQHMNMTFTSEVEQSEKLSFLDVTIRKQESSFETDIFRKQTFSGLGLKIFSAVNINYCLCLVQCLVDRAYRICSDYASFTAELEFLRRYFFRNGYPLSTIERCFRFKLDSFFNPREPIHSVSKKIIYQSLPYMDAKTNAQVKKDLNAIVSQFYPQLVLRLCFRNMFTVGSFFHNKDRIPTLVRSNVVYWYQCGQCDATYCGETTRHLQTRIAEHRGVSARTGRSVASPLNSNIRDHSLNNDHVIQSENFKIISTSNSFDLRTVESIAIHKLNPSLNDHNSSVPLKILG
jgi:hypothetical protein